MSETANYHLDAETIKRGIGSLPSLPTIVVELLQSIDDDDADTDLLAEKISRDQALVAKMLRVANSSFYGLQGRVGSIQDAIVVLGLRGVRTLATAAAITGCLKADSHGGFDFRAFWRHSIATALCARVLAKRLRANEENAFAAGLMHDIGRLALASCFPRHVAAVFAYRKASDCATLDAERAVLGIDHAQVGQLLTTHWKFPVGLSEAIARHHEPDGSTTRISLAGILHLANVISHALDIAGDIDEAVPPIDPAAWAALASSAIDFRSVFEEVDAQFESACETLVG